MKEKFARLLWVGVLVGISAITLAGFGYWQYMERIANPRAARVLMSEPDGERAKQVMMLALPSGRRIPVNYLREADTVYAAADGRWWKELTGPAHPVEVFIRGETLRGVARAIRDDPERTREVFLRLRPNALEGFGTLIEINLEPASSDTGQNDFFD